MRENTMALAQLYQYTQLKATPNFYAIHSMPCAYECWMLVKLTPVVVNFIQIMRDNFCTYLPPLPLPDVNFYLFDTLIL